MANLPVDEDAFIYDNKVDYSQHGKNWPDDFCINGPKNQSPIDIDKAKLTPNDNIRFSIANFTSDANAYIEMMGDDSVIYVHYEPIETEDGNIGYLSLIDERGAEEFYHKEHMLWKVPSEHTVNKRQYSAEL